MSTFVFDRLKYFLYYSNKNNKKLMFFVVSPLNIKTLQNTHKIPLNKKKNNNPKTNKKHPSFSINTATQYHPLILTLTYTHTTTAQINSFTLVVYCFRSLGFWLVVIVKITFVFFLLVLPLGVFFVFKSLICLLCKNFRLFFWR